MYRINDNKRVQHSAFLIKDALLTCLQEKPFKEITVSDIQRLSGVSRATFYRLFDNTNDVLTYHCQLLLDDIIDQTQSMHFQDYEAFLLFLFQALLNNHPFLETIFRSDCEDILLNSLSGTVMQHRARQAYPQADEKEIDYLVSGICGFLIGLLRTWLKHGKQESAQELYAIMTKMGHTLSMSLFNNYTS